jgi:putative PIN family toxin of toxin-antitoxin system
MLKVVIDTTVLISAFLRRLQGGVSFDLLQLVEEGSFEFYTSDQILEEVADTLITREHIRRRYQYPDAAVVEFCKDLARLAVIVGEIPEVHVVRDPDDDMVVACALAADADYLVSRDKDLLSLGEYEGIEMIEPEAFLRVLRAQRSE